MAQNAPWRLENSNILWGRPPRPPQEERAPPPPTWHGTWHYNVEESEIFVTLRSCVMLW